MNNKDIIRLRLTNQRLAGHKAATPTALLREFGAMQAQDFSMVKWAIGMRLDNSSHDAVEAALDKGELLRTHVMRPTWHIVRPADIRWMLALSAPKIRALMAPMEKKLELDEKITRKSKKIIEKTLTKHRSLTRAELMRHLQEAGIVTDENRASHILIHAELDAVICSGPRLGRQFTYALLDDRAPVTAPLSRDLSLAELAGRYFSSHGPATLHDFTWWAGLTLKDGRTAIEMISRQLHQYTLGVNTYWFTEPGPASATPSPGPKPAAHLLPAFDEWIIGYADRTLLFASEHERKIITTNGIFRPAILCNGAITGTWRATQKDNPSGFDPEYFHAITPSSQKAIVAAGKRYHTFCH